MIRGHLRSLSLYIIPNMSGEPIGQLSPLDRTHQTIIEIILQAGNEDIVVHRGVVGQRPPQLGDLDGFGDLELKLVVCPVDEVCV